MQSLLKEIRDTPLLWLLVVVPIVLVAEKAAPEAHTILFVLAARPSPKRRAMRSVAC
jgi:Ca2+:H+ antiporter